MPPVCPAVALGPVVLPQDNEPGDTNVPTASQPATCKHAPSANHTFGPTQAKWTKCSTSQPPPTTPDVQPKQPDSQLYSIPKDNSYDSANPDRVKEFFSILSVPGSSPGDADSMLFEPKDDEESEDFTNDINIVSQNSDSQAASKSEGSEDIFLLTHLPQAPW